jgi:hypothetical protein
MKDFWIQESNETEIRKIKTVPKSNIFILHELHVQPCGYAHCCSLTAGVDAAAAAVTEGQAVDGHSWAEVCWIASSHSTVEHVVAVFEENTTDRDLASSYHHKPDKVQGIVFLLVLAYSHLSA